VNVYSVTKTVKALIALLLADRGELDFDAPVARYWPQFAVNGKQGVKVSHLMSHSAGLPGWQQPMRIEDCLPGLRNLTPTSPPLVARVRVRPIRPVSSASPRRLHVGNVSLLCVWEA
jgi:CubicO group peptidase (beta-lactamase class C family)